MRTFKGVIFDLDGTLLDTIYDLSESVNKVLEMYGHRGHGYEDYKLKIGGGFRNLLLKSFPEGAADDALLDEALPKFTDIYDKNYTNKTRPYEGIPELLEVLKARGIKMAVNSNKRTDYTEVLADKFFADIPFAGVIGERAGRPKKPDPEAALELAEKMGLKQEDIVYIGDSKVDMITGQNAGMGKAGVLWGFRGIDELRAYGADFIAENPKDLEQLFVE